MLIPIAASPGLLKVGGAGEDIAEQLQYHQRTLECIAAVGVLAFRDQEDLTQFRRAIDALPRAAAEAWQDFLKSARCIFLDGRGDLTPIIEATSLNQLLAWATAVTVLRVQPPDLPVNYPQGAASAHPWGKDKAEVFRLDLGSTKSFTRIKRLQSRAEVGVKADLIDDKVLMPLFAYTQPRQVVAIDKYLGDALLRGDSLESLQALLTAFNQHIPVRRFADGQERGAVLIVCTALLKKDEDGSIRHRMLESLGQLMQEVWASNKHGIETVRLDVDASPYLADNELRPPVLFEHDRCLLLTHSPFGVEPTRDAALEPRTTTILTVTTGLVSLVEDVVEGSQPTFTLISPYVPDHALSHRAWIATADAISRRTETIGEFSFAGRLS